MNDIETKAKKQFAHDAAHEYVAAADKLEAEGKAAWVEDPYVDKVVGLLHANDGQVHPSESRAYVVVYLPGSRDGGRYGDFECSDEFDRIALED